MRSSCNQIAWGLLLAMIDFRFNGFDLLPDVLGYGLALAGLSRIAVRHPALRAGQILAIWLLLQACAEVFGLRDDMPAFTVNSYVYTPARLVFSALAFAISLALTCCLCFGFGRLAEAGGRRALARQFHILLIFSLLHGAALLFIFPFGLNGYKDLLLGSVLIGGIIGIVLAVALIMFVRRAGRDEPEDSATFVP